MPTVGNDKGHGSDTFERTGGKGVVVNSVVYEEHSFNARVGDALSRHLKRCGIDEKSIQGSNEPEVSLTARTNFYNRENVDVVISNHANANGNKNVKGICVFAWKNHGPSQRLQQLLVEEYEKLGFETHGTGEHESEVGSWTDLHIVRETEMTTCLIENGFMTNPEDFKKIFLDPTYAELCALAQARALCRFFKVKYIEEEISYQITNQAEQKEEHEMIFHPSNQQLRDSVKIVLTRLSNKEPDGISKQWRKDFEAGKMTVSDGLAIFYYALDKELIQGSMQQDLERKARFSGGPL
jgi:N-acetylmuramoyl-L-alanine amidase